MSVAIRPKSGQRTLADTNAHQLDNSATNGENIKSIVVKAHAANTGKLYLGASDVTTSTGYELDPGESVGIDINSTSAIYIRGTAADKASWVATV